LTHNPSYSNLGVIKPDGKLLCSAIPARSPSNLTARHYFRQAVETRDVAIGPYEIDRRTGQTILTLAYPVLDTAGRVQAVVFAELDLAWIHKLLTEAQLPQEAAFVVIDQHGTVLTREPDRERWVGQSALSTPIFRTMLEQGKEGTAEGIGLDGNRRLFGYGPLITSPKAGTAYVVVAVPIAAAFAEFKRLLARQLVGLGLVAALIIAATWIGSDLVLRRRVKTLVSATDRLRLGDLSARAGLRYGHGQMGRLALAFDGMAAALDARRAEAERTEAAQRRLNETLEQEARRIAHALHDEAGQLLAVVHIALDDCARDLPPAAQERLREVRGHLDQIEEQLRRLSHELRPTILDNLGLVPALNFLAEGVSKRTGLAITVEGSTEGRLPAPVEITLYRVVQEGLTNATKHAKASNVRIQLQREDQEIRCAIGDDGIGFDYPAVSAKEGDCGLGLIGIQERLKALDGALRITSSPGNGTALLVTIPLGA
jgi:signal transduction histidine kinase